MKDRRAGLNMTVAWHSVTALACLVVAGATNGFGDLRYISRVELVLCVVLLGLALIFGLMSCRVGGRADRLIGVAVVVVGVLACVASALRVLLV